eukprot:gene688-8940_t
MEVPNTDDKRVSWRELMQAPDIPNDIDDEEEDLNQQAVRISLPRDYEEEDLQKLKEKKEREEIYRQREHTILVMGESTFDIKIEKKEPKEVAESAFVKENFNKKHRKYTISKRHSMTEFEIKRGLMDPVDTDSKGKKKKKKKIGFMKSYESDSDDDEQVMYIPTTTTPQSENNGKSFFNFFKTSRDTTLQDESPKKQKGLFGKK